jgi:hypothetical protein
MENNTMVAGQKVINDRPFTTPTGIHFPAGSAFIVDLVGRSTRCISEIGGAGVWISDGLFLAGGK